MIVKMNTMMLTAINIKTKMMLMRLMMLNADDDIDYDANSSSGCVAYQAMLQIVFSKR